MSTIKVNNIQSRTGNAISFTSGDTITIPSGATFTNNGTASGFPGLGKIGQVISNNITTRTETSSSTNVDITGSETTIVTTASSSKVLLHISLCMRKENNTYISVDLLRKIGGGSYSKIRDFDAGFLWTNDATTQTGRFATSFLDEPSSADTIYYKMQFNSGANIAVAKVNYDNSETSTITLMEVLA